MKKNLQIGNRVYQRTKAGLGNVPSDPSRTLQNRAYVAHPNSSTPAQIARRQKFRAAAFSWRDQSPATQADYEQRASTRGVTGYNLWISEYLRRP
jgi:hypothetical protein